MIRWSCCVGAQHRIQILRGVPSPGFENSVVPGPVTFSSPRWTARFVVSARLHRMIERLLLYDGRRAVDFDERVSGKRGDCDSRACRPAIWEIGFENFVHAFEICDVREEYGELKNTVHRSTPGLDNVLDLFHHLLDVRVDVAREFALIV